VRVGVFLVAVLWVAGFPLLAMLLEYMIKQSVTNGSAISTLVPYAVSYSIVTKMAPVRIMLIAVGAIAAACYALHLAEFDLPHAEAYVFSGYLIVIIAACVERFHMHVLSGKPFEV